MSDSFSFVVYGKAIGKERPRLGRGGHVYTPAKTRAFEEKVRLLALRARGRRSPLAGPVELRIFFDVIGGKPSVCVEVLPLDASEGWMTGRPDVSNCVKAIEDALRKVLYGDDAQVARLLAERRRRIIP